MKNGTVKTLGELELRELVDLGLRMPDGSKELFEVINKRNDCITVMTKNIIDFMPFNDRNNKHPSNVNSYEESSIRSYLAELYQSVAKENKLLENHTFGHKGFFLPTATDLGFGDEAGKGWQAFKNDASRIKYSGTYASTKDEAYGLGESDWYWTSTPYAASADCVRIVNSAGTLSYYGAYGGLFGAAPALNLKSSAPIVLIDGVWSLYDCISDTSNDESVDVKTGDWIEVTHTAEIDIQEGILLGDCFEVIGNIYEETQNKPEKYVKVHEVEAIEFLELNEEVSSFTNGKISIIDENNCVINSPWGNHVVTKGDFIVKDTGGRIYPCRRSYFKEYYNKVE